MTSKRLVSLRPVGSKWEATVFERSEGSATVSVIVAGTLPFIRRELRQLRRTTPGPFDPTPTATRAPSGTRKLRGSR